jgi:hypothetical protein
VEHRFDALAKELARGVSRREALRQIVGDLTGAALAFFGGGRASGQSWNPSVCYSYCNGVSPWLRWKRCVISCLDCVGHGGARCGVTSYGNVICCAGSHPVCCGHSSTKCYTAGRTCCGTGACPTGYVCAGSGICCQAATPVFCSGQCLPSSIDCCGDGTVCGGYFSHCCPHDQCCHNTDCTDCGPRQTPTASTRPVRAT